jgi:hypothetical protein
MEYHADESKKRVATVLPKDQFFTYTRNASLCPLFVLPISKDHEAQKQRELANAAAASGAAGGSGSGDAKPSTSGQQQPPAFLTLLIQQQLPFTLITTVEEYKM